MLEWGGSMKLLPVSNAILNHQQEIGDAVWTFLWLTDHTTQVRAIGRSQLEGLVANGEKLKPATIAKALGFSVRKVNLHIKVLCKAGFVRKTDSDIPSGFALAAERVVEGSR
jgi:predicted DNA-binding transcriptional regulator